MLITCLNYLINKLQISLAAAVTSGPYKSRRQWRSSRSSRSSERARAISQLAWVDGSLVYLWPSDSEHFSRVMWARCPFLAPCSSSAACAPLTVRPECNSVTADVTLEMRCLVTGSGDSCRAYREMIWWTRRSDGQMRGVLVCNTKPHPPFKEKDAGWKPRLTHRGVRRPGSDASRTVHQEGLRLSSGGTPL